MAESNNTPQRELFAHFVESHLGVEFQGLQSGVGLDYTDDLVLFRGPRGSTLAVSVGALLETPEHARAIVRKKIEASEAAFRIGETHG